MDLEVEGRDPVQVLIARAILDIEVKIRHEIRQNNATLLAKIEKNYEQMNQKLTSLETKINSLAVSATRSHNSYPQHHQQHNIAASRGARTFYTRPNVNSAGSTHPHQAGGNRGARGAAANHRQQQQKMPPFGRNTSSAAISGQPFVLTPSPKFDLEAKQRPNGGSGLKQTLGTGANKTQLGGWTTRAAIGDYTDEDEEEETSEEEIDEEPDVELNVETRSPYVLTKPEDEPEEPNRVAAAAATVATMLRGSNDLDGEMLVATPGASITPVASMMMMSGAGGFGRGRRQ